MFFCYADFLMLIRVPNKRVSSAERNFLELAFRKVFVFLRLLPFSFKIFKIFQEKHSHWTQSFGWDF